MLHHMKLQSEPFHKIKNGRKTIELRLNDEKRQKVRVGDFIEFSQMDDPLQRLTVRVIALHHFNSFAELYAALPKEKLGYASDETPDHDDMHAYYPCDEQEKYGVLGIELRLTDLQKFVDAQEYGYSFGETYETALSEIKNGEKETHWIWYVFPQIQGLGFDVFLEKGCGRGEGLFCQSASWRKARQDLGGAAEASDGRSDDGLRPHGRFQAAFLHDLVPLCRTGAESVPKGAGSILPWGRG